MQCKGHSASPMLYCLPGQSKVSMLLLCWLQHVSPQQYTLRQAQQPLEFVIL